MLGKKQLRGLKVRQARSQLMRSCLSRHASPLRQGEPL